MDKDPNLSFTKKKQLTIKTSSNIFNSNERTQNEQESQDTNNRLNLTDSPKIKFNDNNFLPEFGFSYQVPTPYNSLNINFPNINYQNRRPEPINIISNSICDESPNKNIFQNFCKITVSPINHNMYPFGAFGAGFGNSMNFYNGDSNSNPNSKNIKNSSRNHINLANFTTPDVVEKDRDTYKRRINFEESPQMQTDANRKKVDQHQLRESQHKESQNRDSTNRETADNDPITPNNNNSMSNSNSMSMGGFGQMQQNPNQNRGGFRKGPYPVNSFASCFVNNLTNITNEYNIVRPTSTTNASTLSHNDNIFRSPNDTKKKVSVESLTNPNLNKVAIKIVDTNNDNNNTDPNNIDLESTTAKESLIKLSQPKTVCNCKKSKCLKLYCECFILGQYCDASCNCSPCYNTIENREERDKIVKSLKEKNPAAFRPKIEVNINEEKQKIEKTKHIRGCNCTKTQCQKKYCECYQSGVLCTSLCKCCDCQNDDPERLRKKSKANVIFKTVNEVTVEVGLGLGLGLGMNMNNNPAPHIDRDSFSQEFFKDSSSSKLVGDNHSHSQSQSHSHSHNNSHSHSNMNSHCKIIISNNADISFTEEIDEKVPSVKSVNNELEVKNQQSLQSPTPTSSKNNKISRSNSNKSNNSNSNFNFPNSKSSHEGKEDSDDSEIDMQINNQNVRVNRKNINMSMNMNMNMNSDSKLLTKKRKRIEIEAEGSHSTPKSKSQRKNSKSSNEKNHNDTTAPSSNKRMTRLETKTNTFAKKLIYQNVKNDIFSPTLNSAK